MTCHTCQTACNRFGKHRNGLQRYRCSLCRKTFTEAHARPLNDMRLPMDKAEAILKLLVEGMSVRSIERITQVHRDTILRLLVVAGERCTNLTNDKLQKLSCRHVQCDEIWTFVQKKNRHVHKGDSPDFGDQWVFVALDADTKLVASYVIGKRTMESTQSLMQELYRRIPNHFQLTTDGFHFYIKAVDDAFGLDAPDFAQLTKLYGDYGQHERYSPSPIIEVISKVRYGNPDPKHISTSYVERQNLTMRMHMRRLTRLTNAFSKKLSHLKAAVALHFAFYNLCRVHSSLRITPSMQAGLTDHIWSISELLAV